MQEAVIFCNDENMITYVFGGGRREKISSEFALYPIIISIDNFEQHVAQLQDCKYIFSTWGMPQLTKQQIALLPKLEALFYAAGSVQNFARPFLQQGITVTSSWAANGIPVAEFTFAQILLSSKGFWQAQQACCNHQTRLNHNSKNRPGNYSIEIALLGAGMIGRHVIKLLQGFNIKILLFDPFISKEQAAELNVEKVELDEAFQRGYIVSNHIANLPETEGLIQGKHLAMLPEGATFINTGRGITVCETEMIEILTKRQDITALLDVTYPEPPLPDSPLYSLTNVVLTPHIAGSIGNEVWRMADYAIDEALAFKAGRPLKYSVSLKMLENMA